MEEKRVHVNEKYKDSIFCILYQDDKERQLELYQSVERTIRMQMICKWSH